MAEGELNINSKSSGQSAKIDISSTSASCKKNMTNYGALLLKSGAILLFFLLSKYLFQFLLGSKMEFFIENFWLFVCAGLIPACIACVKGHSFWLWWGAGTFFPIVSTVMVIGLHDLEECSEDNKVIEDDQDIIK